MVPNRQAVGLKWSRSETPVQMKHGRLHAAAFAAKICSGVRDCLEKNVTIAHADRDAHRPTHTAVKLRKEQLTEAEIDSIS